MGKKLFFAVIALVFFHAGKTQCLLLSDLDTCKIYKTLASIKGHENEVYRVDLSKKKLNEIPSEILTLPHLQELRFNKNNLKTLPQALAQCKELQRIEIQFNELDTMPPFLFTMKNLKKIDFGYNYISTIPDGISQLIELEILALWDNPIEKYSKELLNMDQLRHLDFSNNFMSETMQRDMQEALPKCKMYFPMPCQCDFDW